MVMAALFLAGAAAPGTAGAQAPPVDPEAGSPSGTIYEIPLERGRDEGAPRPQGGGAAEPSSPIRSDNGFSSSTTVPGTGEADGAVSPGNPGSDGSGGDGGGGGGSQARDGGSREREPEGEDGLTAAQERSAEVTSAAGVGGGGSPSLARALLLIGLGVAVAGTLGVAAHRSARGG
jgi:hypothetical protein